MNDDECVQWPLCWGHIFLIFILCTCHILEYDDILQYYPGVVDALLFVYLIYVLFILYIIGHMGMKICSIPQFCFGWVRLLLILDRLIDVM